MSAMKKLHRYFTMKEFRDMFDEIMRNNPGSDDVPVFCYFKNIKGALVGIEITEIVRISNDDGNACGLAVDVSGIIAELKNDSH